MPKRVIFKIRLFASFILVRPLHKPVILSVQGKGKVKMSAVYFGGSRHHFAHSPIMQAVINAAIADQHAIYTGCQFGVDALVSAYAVKAGKALHIYTVANTIKSAPYHVQNAAELGATIHTAPLSTAPVRARYLLRSIAAFTPCPIAIFFYPGAGSLAVAREAIKNHKSVYCFTPAPARIPATLGNWAKSQLFGLPCWQWVVNPQQAILF
jgi:hypothetical protein